MYKYIALLCMISLNLGAKIEIEESSMVLSSAIKQRAEKAGTLVVKVFDADDEQGHHLDAEYKNDKKTTMYKITYDQMGGKIGWRKKLVGENAFAGRETVYVVFRNGKIQRRLFAEDVKNKATFRALVAGPVRVAK